MVQKPTNERTMVLTSDVNVRQQIIRATREAARAENVAVNADALAFLSEPRAMFVNAPIAGIEKLDFEALLDGQPVLDDKPIMYWQLSGPAFDGDGSIIHAGHYTVVADGKRGAVSLRTPDGTTIAEGELSIELIPKSPSGVAFFGVSVHGGVDSFKITKKSIKLCAHVSIEVGSASLSVNGCIEIS
jgi:hypothetical protein